jgi:hypothetical protein
MDISNYLGMAQSKIYEAVAALSSIKRDEEIGEMVTSLIDDLVYTTNHIIALKKKGVSNG